MKTSTSTRRISSSRLLTQLPSVQAGKARGPQLVGVQIVSDHGRRRVPWNVELVPLEREDRDVIMVGLVADWWTRPAVSLVAEVGHALCAPTRRVLPVTGPVGESGRGRGDVVHHPMPPPASGRCIRIIHGDGEGFRPGWRIGPLE